jgi:hypothetical protein
LVLKICHLATLAQKIFVSIFQTEFIQSQDSVIHPRPDFQIGESGGMGFIAELEKDLA